MVTNGSIKIENEILNFKKEEWNDFDSNEHCISFRFQFQSAKCFIKKDSKKITGFYEYINMSEKLTKYLYNAMMKASIDNKG